MWKTGPARTRSDEYEAAILATDMGGPMPILIRFRKKGEDEWGHHRVNMKGCAHPSECESPIDLLPPLMTPEEVARECYALYQDCAISIANVIAFRAALDHYDQLIKDGRVACTCGRGE